MKKSKLLHITSLWENLDSNGNTFFSGKLNGINLLMFKNWDKDKPGANEKLPGWKVYISIPLDQDEPTAKPILNNPYLSDEDIPF